MENGPVPLAESSNFPKNGVVSSTMASFPDGTVAVSKDESELKSGDLVNSSEFNTESEAIKPSELNGDFEGSADFDDCNAEDKSSESDALVIDEDTEKRNLPKSKKNRTNTETILHSNPYFSESLYELSQQHVANSVSKKCAIQKCASQKAVHKCKKTKNSKLREYAQYLGLQPALKFKCSKCQQGGFETLYSLHEHMIQCSADPISSTNVEDGSSSSFKLTRKVFLCSACGTYYENWNLYVHMLEYHRRYICLYCLGMFSVLDDLCQHIYNRHNFEPGRKDTVEQFFSAYNEPCYIICCECKKLFSEQDNFFYHSCEDGGKSAPKGKTKAQIRPENHVTGESAPFLNDQLTAVDGELQKSDLSSTSNPVQSECQKSTTVEEESLAEDNLEPSMEAQCEKSNLESAHQKCAPTNPMFSEYDDPSMGLQYQENDESALVNDVDSEHETSEFTSITANSWDPKVELKHCRQNFVETESECAAMFPDNDLVDKQNVSKDTDQVNLNLTDAQNTKMSQFFENGDSTSHPEDEESEPYMLDDEMTEKESRCEAEAAGMEEIRKVPKLSLKIPKLSNSEHFESDDSDRYMEVEQIESENEKCDQKIDVQIAVAGPDINAVELKLEQPLDKFDIKILLQKCLNATAPFCIYCNHARKIAVNGKQLGLHAIAEHRYTAVVNSITAEELLPDNFVARIRECLPSLENVYFNLESHSSNEALTFSHQFECFQCRYSTSVHKELYLHNRKLHTKNLLLCIMCKSNFYSYSELICHLCPGLYMLDFDVQFRCCMCVGDDLPSAFRLMVHLRKRHHVCDVCLEMCQNQYRLSNHVWKHKLHHFCYRCGIAYRNKLDITRHLFWKHGTESVLCKKCLQKKWPHVYHFCVPPNAFSCDECNLSFSRAVALKVHKRIHSDEKPHSCTVEDCTERFISKKLLKKHELSHMQPVEVKDENNVPDETAEKVEVEDEKPNENIEKPKAKIDVYDLPELNLSESDSDSDDADKPNQAARDDSVVAGAEDLSTENTDLSAGDTDLASSPLVTTEAVSAEDSAIVTEINSIPTIVEDSENILPEEEKVDVVLENIWDNFKNYQAKKEKLDTLFENDKTNIPLVDKSDEVTLESALRDHDYFYNPENKIDVNITEVKPDLSQRVDHDYCAPKGANKLQDKNEPEQDIKQTPRQNDKKEEIGLNSPTSSSDSDSSSCSCGSNCSCSSSDSSSSSDDSGSDSSNEETKKQVTKRGRKKKIPDPMQKEVAPIQPNVPVETLIHESDLDTTESETDEEFYDEQPQKLARKILEEKRNKLLAEIGPVPCGGFVENSRPSTPSLPEEELKQKKKFKSKKKKRKKSDRKHDTYSTTKPQTEEYYANQHNPLTITINKNSSTITTPKPQVISAAESEMNLRASKRRRVPNKFYGYSSDEETDKVNAGVKWRKTEHQSLQPMVPPITIKGLPYMQQVLQPTVEPITIKNASRPGEMRIQQKSAPSMMTPSSMRSVPSIRTPSSMTPPVTSPIMTSSMLASSVTTSKLPNQRLFVQDRENSTTDSNDSCVEETPMPPKDKQVQLYCYCRCPYDEVSEMIGCDSHDCAIEWFHFECVGIMVPPKGQWFCPDCRKRKQQRKELL